MAVIAGTVTYPEHVQGDDIVLSALSSVEAGARDRMTVLNFPGCCLGVLSFQHETKGIRTATIGNSGLIWTGYINNIQDLRKRLEACGTDLRNGIGASQILLESYLKFGIKSLQGLNGLYSIAVWDGQQRRFSAITDRYGFTKIYYWHGPDELVFASECKSILSHPKYRRAIDKEGVINFLGAGYCFGERTLFKDIKLIPQGCLLEYENRKLTFKKYWDYSVNPFDGDEESVINTYFKLIQKSFEQCVKGKDRIFIPLTAGFDSRTMAALAAQRGMEIHGCTVGFENSRDFKYGPKIGKRLGAHHIQLNIETDYMAKYGAMGIRLTDGLASFRFYYILRLLDCQDTPHTLISGLGGGEMTGHYRFNDFQKDTDKSPIQQIMERRFLLGFRDDELGKILNSELYPYIGNNSKYLTQRLNDADAEDITDKSWIVSLKERMRRYVSSYLSLLGRNWDVAAPFMDNSFVDFMLRVPIDLTNNQKLVREVICRFFPLVADIPNDKTGKRLMSTWLSWRLEHLKSHMPFKNKNGNRNRSYLNVDYDKVIRSGSSSYFYELFSDRERVDDLFNVDAVNNLLNAHMHKHVNESQKLCAIASIIECRRQFGI